MPLFELYDDSAGDLLPSTVWEDAVILARWSIQLPVRYLGLPLGLAVLTRLGLPATVAVPVEIFFPDLTPGVVAVPAWGCAAAIGLVAFAAILAKARGSNGCFDDLIFAMAWLGAMIGSALALGSPGWTLAIVGILAVVSIVGVGTHFSALRDGDFGDFAGIVWVPTLIAFTTAFAGITTQIRGDEMDPALAAAAIVAFGLANIERARAWFFPPL